MFWSNIEIVEIDYRKKHDNGHGAANRHAVWRYVVRIIYGGMEQSGSSSGS